MNKEWFVFKGTHHLGPFSVEEMEAFFRSEEINAQTLIWKQGNEKWEPLSKAVAFQNLFEPVQSSELPDDLPPPLPAIPALPVPPAEALTHHGLSHVELFNDDLPPPIPLDAIIDPMGQVRGRIKKQEKSDRYSKYALIAGSLVFAFVIGWYSLTQKEASIQLRIKGLMPVYLEKLELTATKNTPRFEVAMALSLDSLTLWASTNFGGEIATVIKMNSIPSRVLGTEDVELALRGKFVNHVGKFNKMILNQGSKFLPGEYNFHVEGRQTHFINRTFKSLSAIDFFKNLNKTYVYDGVALIFPGTPREFEKRLSEYSASLLEERLKPFLDKLERMQTFESILNNTSQIYLMELEKIKIGKDIASFESKFIKEISPLLQSLVMKAYELSVDPKYSEEEKNRKVIAPYREQVLLGKQIGEMASDMITKTQMIKRLTDKDKSGLRALFDKRAKSIKLQIDMNIKLLDEQIQKNSK